MRRRSARHIWSYEFFYWRGSDAESDCYTKPNGDSHSHRNSGCRGNDRASRQEDCQAGARRLGECGCRIERSCQRLSRRSSGLEAGGDCVEAGSECGQSGRRFRSRQRRRKFGGQSGSGGGVHSTGRGQNSRNAIIKPLSGGGRSKRRVGCANNTNSEFVRTGIICALG